MNGAYGSLIPLKGSTTSVPFDRLVDPLSPDAVPFQKLDTIPGVHSNQSLVQTVDQYLEPHQILQTKNGSICVSDVTGRISNVLCPFHADTKPSEFIKKVEATGNVFLFCRIPEPKRAGQGDYEEVEWLYDMGHCTNRLSVLLCDNNIIRLVRIFAPYDLPIVDLRRAA